VEPEKDPAADLYWQALAILDLGRSGDLARGRSLLQQAADLEFAPAQHRLGISLLAGYDGFTKSKRKGANWIRLAAERGDAFARVNLGFCYYSGIGVSKDHQEAEHWLDAAVDPKADYTVPKPPPEFLAAQSRRAPETEATLSGDLPVDRADLVRAKAFLILACISAEKGDLAKAQERYVAAATMGPGGRAGIPAAAGKAAINYAFGRGVPRDMAKATEMLDRGKKLGARASASIAHTLVDAHLVDDFAQADVEEELTDASAEIQSDIQYSIAGSFADSKSPDYNPGEAARWYELAASGGETWAMLSLAFLHNDGRLGRPDPAKSFEWFKQAAEKKGHLLAWANLAICYGNGIGVARDSEKALEICKRKRDQEIVCYLGTIGQLPANILTYDQAAELNRTWASQKKDPQAQYLMGFRCLLGWGAKVSARDAASWFKKAAKAGHRRALCELGDLYYSHWADLGYSAQWEGAKMSVKYLRQAADLGDAEAMSHLAFDYQKGIGIPEDDSQAVIWYEKAIKADPAQVQAYNELGIIYEERLDKAKEQGCPAAEIGELREKMFRHYREADRLGSAAAAWNLGLLAYQGAGDKPDSHEAYVHFDTAANRGLPAAHRYLGQMHEHGEGVPVNFREAAYHYRIAALDGDTKALIRLCEFVFTGKEGVSQDFDRAQFWFIRLQQQGKPGALVPLCDILLGRHDYTTAMKLVRMLTDANDNWIKGAAYERMGRIYAEGLGVELSPSEAQRCYAKARKLGNEDVLFRDAQALLKEGRKAEAIPLIERAVERDLPIANFTLGCLLLAGDGVAQDPARAWALIRKAANEGLVDAQFCAALAALKKIPGAPDLDEALRHAEAAETAGHPKARLVREQLEKLRVQPETHATEAEPRKF